MKFPFHKQLDTMDCGPSCLQMIAEYYGQYYSLQALREKAYLTRNGVSLRGINSAAKSIGFQTKSIRINWTQLSEQVKSPCIVHWDDNHFVVIYGINRKKGKVLIADPAFGRLKYNKDEFIRHWIVNEKHQEGVVLLLETTDEFYGYKTEPHNKFSARRLLKYLRPHTRYLILLIIAILMGSLISLTFPFLTQAIVDVGIEGLDTNLIFIIFVAQLMLILGQLGNDLFRSWLMLHITTRISLSFISDFLKKLMKLPIGFFDVKLVGDIMQRINDNRRIQTFLTGTLISSVFAMITFIIYAIVISQYNLNILAFFLFGSTLYIIWILSFLKKRRELDFRQFKESSSNQNNLIQLVTAMQEIKLNSCEKMKRWEWERIQLKLYQISIKSLTIAQTQEAGGVFINQTKNIVISFMAATAVVKGEMTLGMMIAMQYVLGQLNTPLNQFLNFIQELQDAKISLERLNEIYDKEDEEPIEIEKITNIPYNSDIHFDGVTFCYAGPESERALQDIDLTIEAGKMTAIVGTSGSGKTTLLKLMLGFYSPIYGSIRIGKYPLKDYSERLWRRNCGVVMQEGFIFSDSIANNIGVVDEKPNYKRLRYSAELANIHSFIESLPLGYETKIGGEGHGLSTGQRQRILIARAIYKNPNYIFLDEATNSLDTTNESMIMSNLNKFYTGKTVVIVAHRLSTVKNANKIVVLDKGYIVETGTHEELVRKQGAYYKLIKDQLELNK